jgi:hypothetical protein
MIRLAREGDGEAVFALLCELEQEGWTGARSTGFLPRTCKARTGGF